MLRFKTTSKNGLSLCIQGTWVFLRKPCIQFRFIPVHTGNIRNDRWRRHNFTVYPCAYREHIFRLIDTLDRCGLSLCIQGTWNESLQNHGNARFIPVHTGNIPIITYCFIIKILTAKFLPIF